MDKFHSHKYDLGIAWTWEYDKEFASQIEVTARHNDLSVLQITPQNINEVMQLFEEKNIYLKYYFDRASDEDERFYSLAQVMLHRWEMDKSSATRPINPIDRLRHATDKAIMHLEFLSSGIQVPYSIVISPFNNEREVKLSLSELARLGRPFIIKPANTTGGGIGVVLGAESLMEIIEARQVHKDDKYLLQETIIPTTLAGERAWFRVFYAFGDIIPCWWNDQTHLYRSFSREEKQSKIFSELQSITERIWSICKLDFFSTEMAYTADSRIIVIDYVNEMCDMRYQSMHRDGVPNDIVDAIISKMISMVKTGKNLPEERQLKSLRKNT